jgi:CcmD family protein
MMKMLKRRCAVLVLMLVSGVACGAAQQPTPQPAPTSPTATPSQQNEFIPIDQLPPQEQLAAAPLLIGAYVFVLAVLFVYVFSVARRLTNVQRELDRLDTTIKQGGRA